MGYIWVECQYTHGVVFCLPCSPTSESGEAIVSIVPHLWEWWGNCLHRLPISESGGAINSLAYLSEWWSSCVPCPLYLRVAGTINLHWPFPLRVVGAIVALIPYIWKWWSNCLPVPYQWEGEAVISFVPYQWEWWSSYLPYSYHWDWCK